MSGTGRAPLTLENVTKVFGLARGREVVAVRDVSFEVAPRGISALLGPSGSGKSTILRMIAGLETATSGVIRAGDRLVDGPGRDRGMVFQEYTSFDWLTVAGNVEYGLRINGVRRAERIATARRFLDLVRLTRFADAYPTELSGGMRQRVAIARTLAVRPDFLLMDEPFGALDAETRWHMQELLLRVVNETGIAVVLVTHDIEEALFLADRIVVLSPQPGRIREIIEPGLRPDGALTRKEDFLARAGAGALEARILGLMREAHHEDG